MPSIKSVSFGTTIKIIEMASRTNFTLVEQLQSELKSSRQLCKSLEGIRKTQADEINALAGAKEWLNDDCMSGLLEDECSSLDLMCAQKDSELFALREQVRIMQEVGKSRNDQNDRFWKWYNKAKWDTNKHTDAAYYLPSKYWEHVYTIDRMNKEIDELKEKLKKKELPQIVLSDASSDDEGVSST